MFRMQYIALGAVAAVTAIALSTPADATHRRCGYDRYGYHAPDFRGCYDRWAYRRDFYPAPYPVRRRPAAVYERVRVYERVVVPSVRCFYDTGYDMRVRRICVDNY